MRYILLCFIGATAAVAAWQAPVNLGATLNTARNEWYPFLARDGSFMLFVSDRPGGRGRADLWRTDNVGGAWQRPVNLGGLVNSADVESAPFLAENDTQLYFTSTAPGGHGSYDIWRCPMSGGTPSGPKVNVGPPINTPQIDC